MVVGKQMVTRGCGRRLPFFVGLPLKRGIIIGLSYMKEELVRELEEIAKKG